MASVGSATAAEGDAGAPVGIVAFGAAILLAAVLAASFGRIPKRDDRRAGRRDRGDDAGVYPASDGGGRGAKGSKDSHGDSDGAGDGGGGD